VPVDLLVRIVNDGFLTAPLEATLVDSIPGGTVVELSDKPLTGLREETRVLRLTVSVRTTADFTIAFRTRHNVSDLGGRDRILFVALCPFARRH
jgi:hypothetical protein